MVIKVYKIINKQTDSLALREDLQTISEYCAVNKLCLNSHKGFCILFSRKIYSLLHHMNLKIKNVCITNVVKEKDLMKILDYWNFYLRTSDVPATH